MVRMWARVALPTLHQRGDLLFAERNETRKNLVPKLIVRNDEMCSAFINDALPEINKYRITLG